jgi:translocation and assembly module TamB
VTAKVKTVTSTTPSGNSPRRLRRWLRYFFAAALVSTVAFAIILQTAWFRDWLHRQVVAELEQATGGRVELGSFHTIPMRLQVDLRNVTIHGSEPPGAAPLLHVDRALAQLRFVSPFGRHFALDELDLDHPVVHLAVAPDGSDNIPDAPGGHAGKNVAEQWFDLSIARLELSHGALFWNDQRLPLDLSARDVEARLARGLFRRRFAGHIRATKVDTRLQSFAPFTWAGDLDFELSRNRLDVKSLEITSGRSRLQASGAWVDFARPIIDVHYQASVFLNELGIFLRQPALAAGTVEMNGEGKYLTGTFESSGKLVAKAVELRRGSSTIRNATVDTQYRLDNQKLQLIETQGKIFSGSFRGDAEVRRWLASATPKRGELQSGRVSLKLRDLSLVEITQAFVSRDLPLDRLHLIAKVDGALETKWQKALSRAETGMDLNFTASGAAAPGNLPLTGSLRATYAAADQTLQVDSASLSAVASHLEAAGNLGGSAALRVTATSNNLGELMPLFAAFPGTARLPFHLLGHAAFHGNLTGPLDQPHAIGHLELTDFETVFPPSPQWPISSLHWDTLACDLDASSQAIKLHRGSLQRGAMAADFEVEAGLVNGEFREENPVRVSLALRHAEAAEILRLSGSSEPITGTLNLDLQAAGTRGLPRGEGTLSLRDASIYGEQVPRLDSRFRIAGRDIEFYDLQGVYGPGGHLVGSLAYNLDTHDVRADLRGNEFALAQLPYVRASRFQVAGILSFAAKISGSREQPVVNATADVPDLILAGEHEGALHLEAKSQDRNLHLSGTSLLERARLEFSGDLGLQPDWPLRARAHFSQLDIDPLLRTYVTRHVTGHSSVEGDVSISGPLRQPALWQAEGNLTQASADIENIKLHNDGPIRFRVANRQLAIEQFHLAGDGTDLQANGTVGLDGNRSLHLSAHGSLNLALLQPFAKGLLLSGATTVSTEIRGTWQDPVLEGKLDVANGGVAAEDLPVALSGINGTLAFNRDRLEIQQLSARSGGGTLTLSGFLAYGKDVEFDIRARGDDIRLRYPPGVSSTATADLRLLGNRSGATLSGELTVTRFGVGKNFDFTSLGSLGGPNRAPTSPDSPLAKLQLDVHLLSTPELRMSSSLARVSGEADVRLRGTAAKPALIGHISLQEGDIYFNGSKYQLERGEITFTNPVRIDPSFDLTASTRVRDYDVEIHFQGTTDNLRPRYKSEPPLPEADIIALLALGRTQEESARLASSQSGFTQEASNAILGQAINATVSNRVQKLFGVSRIKIDPQASGTATTNARGPQLTIEQQISNQFTLTYIQDVAQASQQTIQGEFNITRNVSVVAVRDQNGVFALDIRIRRRKK